MSIISIKKKEKNLVKVKNPSIYVKSPIPLCNYTKMEKKINIVNIVERAKFLL